ncbi:Uncharacterised protein [Serratia fonticola]|uniref:Uncharacterized protein n=1 Tax=Serratia fonticola TaxID=47917 RepID=A0A4U9WHK4_SERFO|nr:Uncharacterised protein [Serratia fonticola]
MKWTYDVSPYVVPSLLMCCVLAFSGSVVSDDVLGEGARQHGRRHCRDALCN